MGPIYLNARFRSEQKHATATVKAEDVLKELPAGHPVRQALRAAVQAESLRRDADAARRYVEIRDMVYPGLSDGSYLNGIEEDAIGKLREFVAAKLQRLSK